MDKTECNLSNLFGTLINPNPAPRLAACPSARFEAEKYLAHTFFFPDIYQSPALIEKNVQIMTMQMGLLRLDTAPTPHLEDFANAQTRDKSKRTGKNLYSGEHVKCPDCNMCFHSDVAMFSHIQIHQDKGSSSFKNLSIKKPQAKPKSQPNAGLEPNRFVLRKLAGVWTATKSQIPEIPDRKTPEEGAASILIDMSKSTWNCQSEKNRMAGVPLSEEEEEVMAILNGMPNLIQNSGSRKRRVSESAWLENKKQRKNAIRSIELQCHELQEISDGKAHVCEICGEGFVTGPKLGGHKRKHYQKKPCDQK